LSRHGWCLFLWLWVPLSASALSLEVKTLSSTLLLTDNDSQDLDPTVGRIRYKGTLDRRSDSPIEFAVDLQATKTPNGWTATLKTPELSNLGLPTQLALTVSEENLNLGAPVALTGSYQGEWSDVTDGRQQLDSTESWQVTSDGASLQKRNLGRVKGQGNASIKKNWSISTVRPLENIASTFKLGLGLGDSLTIKKLQLDLKGTPTKDSRPPYWAALGLIALPLLLWGLGRLRKKSRR